MINRKLFDKVLKEKENNKISIILGPRQVGKTTILRMVYDKISKDHKCLFLDLDILENFEKVSSYETLINTLKLNGYKEGQKDLFYLFLDEFQRYEDLSIIMKNAYDNLKNVKIYATGSSTLKIKDRIQESLARRKILHYLYPLDFEEFLWFKADKSMIKHFDNILNLSGESINIGGLKSLLEEFLVFGGYPELVLSKTKEEKIEVLRNIFDLYVKKELVGYLKFGKLLGIKKLIEYLAINNGQKIKYDDASGAVSIKQYEAKEYIEILKETFLLDIVRPFYTNKNKELVKIPKIYFMDNGVRNFFVNNFNDLKLRDDPGFLFEAYVFQEMVKSSVENIKFWQDKQKHEVDFIIDSISLQVPIEVKYKKKLKNDDFIGLNNFTQEYKSKRSYLINLGIQKRSGNISTMLPFKINKTLNIK